jgi:hypothetical protein
MTSRLSTAAPILAVLAILVVTLGAYVGGYFCQADIVAKYKHLHNPLLSVPVASCRIHSTRPR